MAQRTSVMNSSGSLIGFVPRLPWESQDVSSLNLAASSGCRHFFGVAQEHGSCINLKPACSSWTRLERDGLLDLAPDELVASMARGPRQGRRAEMGRLS